MNEKLIPNIRAYASRRQIEIVESLGAGKDGIVMVGKSKSKPARVAIKAHHFAELYLRERQVYERLGELRVDTVLGFSAPHLLDSDENLLVLEMTIVERPFVLDFAGAYVDRRPDFPREV